jgi:hypothetical protein
MVNVTDQFGDAGVGYGIGVSMYNPIVATMTPSSSLIYAGNSVTVVTAASGGRYPYNFGNFILTPGNLQGNLQLTPIGINVGYGAQDSFYFASGGSYVISETVGDLNGGTVTVSTPITVISPVAPLGIAMVPATATMDAGQSLELANITTGGTGPYSYSYAVPAGVSESNGDGNQFGFPAPGTYTITETVKDSQSETASNSVIVTINPSPAISVAPRLSTIDTGQSVTFTNITSYGMPPYAYAYSVLQFGSPASAGNYILNGNTIQFTNPGTYNVVETVMDNASESAFGLPR